MNTAIKLVKTNDGLIGVDIGTHSEVIWMAKVENVIHIVQQHYNRPNAYSQEKIAREVHLAIHTMNATNSNIAVFGIAGSFMYPTKSEEI